MKTKTKTYKWDNGIVLEPKGHRIFRENRGEFAAPETLRWAIADNSGQRPDTTDDGVLWLDFGRPLQVGPDFCGIPVRVERDGQAESRCPCGIDAIITLKSKFPNWRLEPDAYASKVLQLFMIHCGEKPEPRGFVRVYVASARCTNVLGTHSFMEFDEDHDKALSVLSVMLEDARGDDGYETLCMRVTPVEVPARTANIKEWLLRNKDLWAAEE